MGTNIAYVVVICTRLTLFIVTLSPFPSFCSLPSFGASHLNVNLREEKSKFMVVANKPRLVTSLAKLPDASVFSARYLCKAFLYNPSNKLISTCGTWSKRCLSSFLASHLLSSCVNLPVYYRSIHFLIVCIHKIRGKWRRGSRRDNLEPYLLGDLVRAYT